MYKNRNVFTLVPVWIYIACSDICKSGYRGKQVYGGQTWVNQ